MFLSVQVSIHPRQKQAHISKPAALVTLALLFGGLEAFLSAHAYGYSRGELLAVCALASVLAVGLYAWRHGGWAVLGLLAVLTLARDPLWEKLLEPAADMFRSAGTRRAGLPLLILTAGVLALLLGWLVVRARCWYLCALVVTLPVLPPIMEGVLQEWTALLLSAAGWGTLLLTALWLLAGVIRHSGQGRGRDPL